jgi:hypothetical protein
MTGCVLCGRRRRYGRELCSTCRLLIGPMIGGLAARPERPARRVLSYPRAIRCSWPAVDLSRAHNAYGRGARDELTTAMESEYRRRNRLRRCAAAS